MFPGTLDVNRSIQYCERLRNKWSGLKYFTSTEKLDTEVNSSPKLLTLHIVWTWAKEIIQTLCGSIFGDATYNVTVFEYKVVCFTTLDGNQQHRPLMTSYILQSTANQWRIMFDYVGEHVLVHNTDVYVLTSDNEKAISSGLQSSKMKDKTLHLICPLHVKWNVHDHKYVRIYSYSYKKYWLRCYAWKADVVQKYLTLNRRGCGQIWCVMRKDPKLSS